MGDFDKSDLPALPSSVEAREAYFTWGREKYADEIRMITEYVNEQSAAGNTTAIIGFTVRIPWSGDYTPVTQERWQEAKMTLNFIQQYFTHLNYLAKSTGNQTITSKDQLQHKTSLLISEGPGRNVRLHVMWLHVDWRELPHQSVFVVNR